MNKKFNISVTDQKNVNDNLLIELTLDNLHKYYLHISQAEQKIIEGQKVDIVKYAISEMQKWVDKEKGLPHYKHMVYTSGGKFPTDDPATHLTIKKTSDLIRTNVTIAAPLFEWAKSKATKDETSFSDLVSKGLSLIKNSNKVANSWNKEQGELFRAKLGAKGKYGSLEVFHHIGINNHFEIQDLKDALKKSELHNTGWPIGVYLEGGEQKPSAQIDGIMAEYEDTPSLISDYWYAKQNGDFYFSRILESDSGHGEAKPGTVLYFDTLVWRVAESIEHCIKYYTELGVDDTEVVSLYINLYGLNNRSLSAWNPGRAFSLRHYISTSDVAKWEIETKIAELEDGLDDLIYDAVKKLLVMFDFFVPSKEVILDILNREYRKSRM